MIMLNDMTLSDRVRTARLWFVQAHSGKTPFDARTGRNFITLLEEIERDAAEVEARGGNVLLFRKGLIARREGGAS